MNKTIKFTAAVAMIGLLAFAAAGCGGGDKKKRCGERYIEVRRHELC